MFPRPLFGVLTFDPYPQTDVLTNLKRRSRHSAGDVELEKQRLQRDIQELNEVCLVPHSMASRGASVVLTLWWCVQTLDARQQRLDDTLAELSDLRKARSKQAQQVGELSADKEELLATNQRLGERVRSLTVELEQQQAHAKNVARNAELETRELRNQLARVQVRVPPLWRVLCVHTCRC